MATEVHTGAVIVEGPQGCGKTKNAEALARHFGKTQIIDDWKVGDALPANALCLTQYAGTHAHISYAAIAAEIGIQPANPKFCKDCAHHHVQPNWKFAYCSAPAIPLDPVDGSPAGICKWLREPSGLCGPTAILFESATKIPSHTPS